MGDANPRTRESVVLALGRKRPEHEEKAVTAYIRWRGHARTGLPQLDGWPVRTAAPGIQPFRHQPGRANGRGGSRNRAGLPPPLFRPGAAS